MDDGRSAETTMARGENIRTPQPPAKEVVKVVVSSSLRDWAYFRRADSPPRLAEVIFESFSGEPLTLHQGLLAAWIPYAVSD